MSSRTRSKKRFWRTVCQLSLIYAIIIPVVFYLFDQDTFLKLANKDIALFILEIAGAAFGIAYIISFWGRRDPELGKW
jgi:hypothetical protein